MKKIILTLSLIVAAVGATFSQTASAIWQPYDVNVAKATGIRYMDAVDSNTVWAITYDGTSPLRNSKTFVKTGNGKVFTKGSFLADTITYNSSNIVALDSMTAYISLWPKAAGTSAGNTHGISGKIIKTTDGGVTWHNASDSLTMFKSKNNFPDWVTFWDKNNGIALGDPNGSTTAGNGNRFEIWRTHNGGTSWTRVIDANVPAPKTGEYGLTNCFFALGKFVWYGTGIGRVYMSSDSGQTWMATPAAFGLAGGVQGLAFRDSLHGICWGLTVSGATQNSLYKTIDGGMTWQALTPDPNNTGLGAFCVIPGRNAYMSVGANSGPTAYVTSVTNDDGATWNILETAANTAANQTPFDMLNVQMLDSLHGWAGCFSDTTSPLGKSGITKYMGSSIKFSCPININTNKTTICSGDSVILSADGLNTYTWSPSGANTTTVTVKPSSTTIYTVSGTTSLGCANADTISIMVNPTPAINLSFTDSSICLGNKIKFSAHGATTYSWSPSTGLNSPLGPAPIASPTATTTYTLTGTTGSCFSRATTKVTLLNTKISVNSTDTMCNYVPINIVASGATSYTWAPATGLNTTMGATVTASSTVSITYTITGTQGACVDTVTTKIFEGCTGIASVTNKNYVSIYPNPSNGLLTITTSNADVNTNLVVTNLIGQEVFKTSIKDVNTNLDLTVLQKGIYMLTITNGQYRQIEKIIIQ